MLRSWRFSRPASSLTRFEYRLRSVSLLRVSRPSIFSIRLKLRSSHLIFTRVSRPWMREMMLLSRRSSYRFSMPNRLSISRMSKKREKRRRYFWSSNHKRFHNLLLYESSKCVSSHVFMSSRSKMRSSLWYVTMYFSINSSQIAAGCTRAGSFSIF